MRYYELFFYATDELLKDWYEDDDGILCQTFFIKTMKPLKSIEKTKKRLKKTFAPSGECHTDLCNCLKASTVDALAFYEEVSPVEFTMGCGIEA